MKAATQFTAPTVVDEVPPVWPAVGLLTTEEASHVARLLRQSRPARAADLLMECLGYRPIEPIRPDGRA